MFDQAKLPEVLTPKAYFFGRDGLWNSFDVGLSLASRRFELGSMVMMKTWEDMAWLGALPWNVSWGV